MIYRTSALAVVLALLSPTVFGQDVSTKEDASKKEDALAFESELHDGVREGYLTLKWNAVDGAERYRVISPGGEPVYEGHINQAFLSGLSDGTFEFRVQAISSTGLTIATSSPTKVIVSHWSLRQAMFLFVIGLIVVLSIVIALFYGTRLTKQGAAE